MGIIYGKQLCGHNFFRDLGFFCCLLVWLCYHTIYHLNRSGKYTKMMEENKVTVSTNSVLHHRGEHGYRSIHFLINNLFGEGECQRLQEVY